MKLLLHIGPPKSATTWFHRCLADNPQINTAAKDSINFFDINFHRGTDWFKQHFATQDPEKPYLDTTQSYIMSWQALKRISSLEDRPKVVITLRDPIDRAFSHYWHSKKKNDINFEFDPLKNYDRFSTLIEAGLVAPQITFLRQTIGDENVLILDFKEVATDPAGTMARAYDFYEIENTSNDDAVFSVINKAGRRKGRFYAYSEKAWRRLGLPTSTGPLRPIFEWTTGRTEYAKGIDPATRAALIKLIETDLSAMSRLVDFDTSSWYQAK